MKALSHDCGQIVFFILFSSFFPCYPFLVISSGNSKCFYHLTIYKLNVRLSAIDGHICQHLITLHRKFKSIIYQIITLERSSAYLQANYYIKRILIIFVADFKRPSKRSVPFKGCGATVALPSAKLKQWVDKIKLGWFEHMTLQSHMQSLPDISCSHYSSYYCHIYTFNTCSLLEFGNFCDRQDNRAEWHLIQLNVFLESSHIYMRFDLIFSFPAKEASPTKWDM